MKCSKMTFLESHEMFRCDISRESYEMFQYDIFWTTWNVPIWNFQCHIKCSNMKFPESHEMFLYGISRTTWNVAAWHFQSQMKCCSMTFPWSHDMFQYDISRESHDMFQYDISRESHAWNVSVVRRNIPVCCAITRQVFLSFHEFC